MSILLINQPPSAPVTDAATSWTPVVDSFKFNNLGVSNPVDYDFSDDTVKKGVQINIGGSNYQVTADEPITGTTSIYVKITASGSTASAAYVTDLIGVDWNDTYNFYADSSGNAYLFSEALSGISDPKTIIGKFAEDARVKLLTATGKAKIFGAYSDTSGYIEISNNANGSYISLYDGANGLQGVLRSYETGGYQLSLGAGGIETAGNITQTAGVTSLKATTISGTLTCAGNQIELTGSSPRFHMWETGSTSAWTFLADGDHLYLRNGGTFGDTVVKFSKLNNVLVKTDSDNGIDALQVAGSIYASGALTCATIDTGNGATEIYDMNQDLKTTNAVTFAGITSSLGYKLTGQKNDTSISEADLFTYLNGKLSDLAIGSYIICSGVIVEASGLFVVSSINRASTTKYNIWGRNDGATQLYSVDSGGTSTWDVSISF